MRFLRCVLMVVGSIVSIGVLPSGAAAASTPRELHIVKDCSTNNGVAPAYCTITASNVAAIPPGTRIWYLGPVLTNSYFLSSNVKFDDDHGNTSTGYCIFQAKSSLGLCTFWAGTGSLAGFTSVVDVTIDSDGLWHFDGEYYFDDVPRPPDTSTAGGRVTAHRPGHSRS